MGLKRRVNDGGRVSPLTWPKESRAADRFFRRTSERFNRISQWSATDRGNESTKSALTNDRRQIQFPIVSRKSGRLNFSAGATNSAQVLISIDPANDSAWINA